MKTLRRQIKEARISLNNQLWQSKTLQLGYVKLQKNFEQMMTAFNMNQKLIQTYINIIKSKIKVKASSMQIIYKLLSQNKTNQIIFKKFSDEELISYKLKQEEQKAEKLKIDNHKIFAQNKIKNTRFHHSNQQENKNFQQTIQNNNIQKSQINQEQQKKNLWIQRAYSRLAEKMVSKITLYILRKKILSFIAPIILEHTKKLQILMRRITDLKDLKFYYEFIEKIYEENSIFQEKIYKQIVQKGYVLSLQQFYRVNGVEILQQRASFKRISRQSISTDSFQSILPVQKFQEKESVYMRTISKQKQQKIKTIKKQMNHHQRRNPIFLTKMNKQIQSKYADLLDKISDFIATKKQQNKTQTYDNKNRGIEDDVIQQSLSSIQSFGNQEDQYSKSTQNKNRLFRFKEVQKPLRAKSNQTQFKYFSSQFSKIIKDLDDKKGKTFKKNSGQDPFGQTLKVNTDAIVYRNPENIARLLMNGLNLNCDQRKISNIIQKDKNYSVKRLLKLYQARNAQNHVIDLIINSKIPQIEAKILKEKQRYSRRYSNLNGSMFKRLEGLIQKSTSNRSGHEELELLSLQKRNRKKINLNKFQSRMSVKLSKTERFNINQVSQNRNKSPRQQKGKENTKKSNFYTTSKYQENNLNVQTNNLVASIRSQKQIKQVQREIRSSDKVIKLLKEKAKFGIPQNVFKQFKNPLNEGCGFYCDKVYNIIKKNVQKESNMLELSKRSSNTTFRNNKLIKKGIFKVLKQKQNEYRPTQKIHLQKNKVESLKIEQKNTKINIYQKFIKKISQNEIKPVQNQNNQNYLIKNTISSFVKSQFCQGEFIKELQSQKKLNSKLKQSEHYATSYNEKQNNFKIKGYHNNDFDKKGFDHFYHNKGFDHFYHNKTSFNSIHKEHQNLPLFVKSMSINVSPFVSPGKNQDQQKRLIFEIEKDLMKLQKEHQLIRTKKINKLYPFFIKNNKKSAQQYLYSIYSTKLKKIIN